VAATVQHSIADSMVQHGPTQHRHSEGIKHPHKCFLQVSHTP
jgi:hypothetical protein